VKPVAIPSKRGSVLRYPFLSPRDAARILLGPGVNVVMIANGINAAKSIALVLSLCTEDATGE
jgi:hypothetical protein